MGSKGRTIRRRYGLAALGLLAALAAAPPAVGEDKVGIPPDEMVEFLLVMDVMDQFGDAIDLEADLEADQQSEEIPRPSAGEGG